MEIDIESIISDLMYFNIDVDKRVKTNEYISNDLETLKRFYTLLLNYTTELENKNDKYKRLVYQYERDIEDLHNNVSNINYYSFYTESLKSQLRSEQTRYAGCVALYKKEKAKRQQYELLLEQALESNKRLQKFQNDILEQLNKCLDNQEKM